MTDYPTPSDEDLHAFIDGELDPARALAVAAAIQRDQALAQKVAAFNADKARIAQGHRGVLNEPLPAAWTDMIAAHGRETGHETAREKPPEQARIIKLRLAFTPTRAFMALAASLLLIFIGITAYRGVMPFSEETAVAEAVAAYGGTLRAPTTVTVADAGTALNDALSAGVGRALKIPDLTKLGYSLDAVQVYADTPGGKAVKLAYRDKDNRVFTVYLKPSPGAPRFAMLKQDTVRICIWQDDVLSTIMVGDMSAAEMLRLASLAYTGLT